MADLELARGVLSLFIPKHEKEQYNLDSLEHNKTNYLNPNLRETITDLTYLLELYGQEGGVLCIVMEHKSEGALAGGGVNVPLQLRFQEIEVMRDKAASHPKGMMPPIKLILFYHGNKPYSGLLTVAERISGPPELVPARWKGKDMQVIDLTQFSDEALAREGKVGIFLLALKHIYSDNILEVLRRWAPLLQEAVAARDGDDFLDCLFTYLLTGSNIQTQQEIQQFAMETLSEDKGERVMSIMERETNKAAEIATKKANEEAIKKAREASEAIARKMYANGVDLATISQYIDLSIGELESLLLPKAS